MRDSPRIRPARLDDSAEIARLTSELGYPATVEEIRLTLKGLLESAKYSVTVADGDGNQLTGWIVVERRVFLESGEKAEITGLVVSVSDRRAGIGKALVAHAEHWTVRQGLTSIRVRSNVSRTESHPFYEGLGYLRKKTQHAYEKLLSA
jgi:ribosomal protein S18 acetylase RimI-like enzyme